MGKIDLTSVLYLGFRLAPFIIVSVFSLTSLIHQDFKGLIYLGGLLFACFISILVGNNFPRTFRVSDENKDNNTVPNDNDPFETKVRICNLITLTDSGPLSIIPLNIVIISYTYSYLLYIIRFHGLVNNNLPTIVIFAILLFTEMIWNIKNGCANFLALCVGTMIGGGIGLVWSRMVDVSGMTNLKYYNGISTQVTCSRPSEQKFKCSIQPSK